MLEPPLVCDYSIVIEVKKIKKSTNAANDVSFILSHRLIAKYQSAEGIENRENVVKINLAYVVILPIIVILVERYYYYLLA